ncbi:hypothetical protein EV683_1252 [Crenobacter luteus]|uniref:DUF2917 domain-containing protein n=1 Tax=Crenobacter luteus TaxID=1452487 RepID=A0A165F2T6_9NEIS|nr:hypothetical protein [Crenobacter luteus]KZE30289.1 hypothetical protein AVW16_12365 [Crenobacter luteus]TCP10272.1 hypothetical protein EV683_1252 [Crenobacter luteus]
MHTQVSLNPGEVVRLPAGSRWECVGGFGWLTQHGQDVKLRCGFALDVGDPAGAVVEALGGPLQLRLAETTAPAFARLIGALGRLA